MLVAAHGNSLRSLVKHLEGMSPEAVVELNLPTGEPLVYELDDDLQPVHEPGPGRVARPLPRPGPRLRQGRRGREASRLTRAERDLVAVPTARTSGTGSAKPRTNTGPSGSYSTPSR